VSCLIRDGKLYPRTLEYSAAYHCNLACDQCSHLSPYTATQFPKPESLRADLARLAPVMHTPEFRLLGGEPLLNPAIAELAQIVRESGISDTIAVTTNGVLLHRMDQTLWEYIDRLQVTIYPEAAPNENTLANIAARAEETDTELCIIRRPTFRAMALTQPQPDDLIARMVFRGCQNAHIKQCHMLSEGHLFLCALPLGLGSFLGRLSEHSYSPAGDGFDLYGSGDLLSELHAYLNPPTPMECCRYCLGDAGVRSEHRQLTRAELADPSLLRVTRATHLSGAMLARLLAVRSYNDLRRAVGMPPSWLQSRN